MDIAKKLKIRHSAAVVSMDYSIKQKPKNSSPNLYGENKGENYSSTIEKLFQQPSSCLAKIIKKNSFFSTNIRFPSSFNNSPDNKGKPSSEINGKKSLTNPLDSSLSFNSPTKINQENLKSNYQSENNLNIINFENEAMLSIKKNINEKDSSEEKSSSNSSKSLKKKLGNKNEPPKKIKRILSSSLDLGLNLPDSQKRYSCNLPAKKFEIDYFLTSIKVSSIPDISPSFHEEPETIPSQRQNKDKILCKYLSFEEILRVYNSLPVQSVDADLWIKSYFEYFCFCCLKKVQDFPQEYHEQCEKLIIFAYSGYSSSDSFHLNLLFSAYNGLKNSSQGKGKWTEIGFSSNSPTEKDLTHDMSSLGLMMIIFLENYFPATLKYMVGYCLEQQIAFVPLVFDITETVIIALREKKLNSFMVESQKCLEIVFFCFAGSIIYWLSIHKIDPKPHYKINADVEKVLAKNINEVILLAIDHLKYQFCMNTY